MFGEFVDRICCESIVVTAAGTWSMSTPVPESGVVANTLTVGSTVLAASLAAGAVCARTADTRTHHAADASNTPRHIAAFLPEFGQRFKGYAEGSSARRR